MVTRTLGPFHFEDLEPHRFEDLVRNLVYDFRDWQALEATGRTGSDEGYDARGWERIHSDQRTDDSEEATEDSLEPRPEQKVWMIQCKREKELGPAAVKKIIEDNVDSAAPPYGYLLAAPVNFSKTSQDAFRAALRERGVSECYLWGKGEIEDQLLQPKNDRILFAFFGVSLVTRRRSRTTDVRATVVVKNKLFRTFKHDWRDDLYEAILVRDINDDQYPFKGKIKDFEAKPRWHEVIVSGFHPHGLIVDLRKRLAYVNRATKEFDVVTAVDLLHRPSDSDSAFNNDDWKSRQQIMDFHEHIPERHRATITVQGIIRFQDILLVDDKGDSAFECPHIFVDYELGEYLAAPFGPTYATWLEAVMESKASFMIPEDEYIEVDFFPTEFPEPAKRNTITDRKISLPRNHMAICGEDTRLLFDQGEKGDFTLGDMLELENSQIGRDSGPKWAEVIDINYLKAEECSRTYWVEKEALERLVGKKLKKTDKVRIVEFNVLTYYLTGNSVDYHNG